MFFFPSHRIQTGLLSRSDFLNIYDTKGNPKSKSSLCFSVPSWLQKGKVRSYNPMNDPHSPSLWKILWIIHKKIFIRREKERRWVIFYQILLTYFQRRKCNARFDFFNIYV